MTIDVIDFWSAIACALFGGMLVVALCDFAQLIYRGWKTTRKR